MLKQAYARLINTSKVEQKSVIITLRDIIY